MDLGIWKYLLAVRYFSELIDKKRKPHFEYINSYVIFNMEFYHHKPKIEQASMILKILGLCAYVYQ